MNDDTINITAGRYVTLAVICWPLIHLFNIAIVDKNCLIKGLSHLQHYADLSGTEHKKWIALHVILNLYEQPYADLKHSYTNLYN